jgi:hypothetical protein
MSNKRNATSIVPGDIVFVTQDKFDFSVDKLASAFSRTLVTYFQIIDFHWNTSPLYKVYEDGKEFVQVESHSWITARTIEPITRGVHYIELESCVAEILVGVVRKDFSTKDYIHHHNGWGLYVVEGTLHHTMNDKPYMARMSTRTSRRIGMIIDMEQHTLRYAVDGVVEGIAFDNLPDEIYVAGSTLSAHDRIKINNVDAFTRHSMINQAFFSSK